jgi:hypothetical protein
MAYELIHVVTKTKGSQLRLSRKLLFRLVFKKEKVARERQESMIKDEQTTNKTFREPRRRMMLDTKEEMS